MIRGRPVIDVLETHPPPRVGIVKDDPNSVTDTDVESNGPIERCPWPS
jgi:hypothetical protein